MKTATMQAPATEAKRTVWSGLVFLTQVSRPGLWTTTALFYLMPLGHRAFFRSWIFWVGLFYVLAPLGLVLYGVNDIVDAEADVYNPRKGTFLFGSLGAREQLAALRWEIAVAHCRSWRCSWPLSGRRSCCGMRRWPPRWLSTILLAWDGRGVRRLMS